MCMLICVCLRSCASKACGIPMCKRKISGVSDGRDFENVLNLLNCSGKSPFFWFFVLLSSTAGITLKQSDNGGIILRSLDELLQGQFTISICVHLPENLICAFLRCGFVLRHLHHRGNHLVNGRYDLEHLGLAYVPIPVQVVHTERPLQFLVQPTTWGHAQGDDELPEVYSPVSVGIKCAEDVLSKLWGVAVREEVGVDLLELLHGQRAAGAVPQEALVPLGDLVLGEVRVLHQVLHDVGTELAVLFTHGHCLRWGCGRCEGSDALDCSLLSCCGGFVRSLFRSPLIVRGR